MSTKNFATFAAVATILAGCASADLSDNTPPQPEKQYRTGSNIPRRADSMPDGVSTATVKPSDAGIGTGGMPAPRPGGR